MGRKKGTRRRSLATVSRSGRRKRRRGERWRKRERDRRIRKWRSVPRDTRSLRLFWPGSHFHGFMGSRRNLWPSRIYSRATSAGTFASQVAAASPLVTDSPSGFTLSSLPLFYAHTYPAVRDCSYFPKFRWERAAQLCRDRHPHVAAGSPPAFSIVRAWYNGYTVLCIGAGIDAMDTARVAPVQSWSLVFLSLTGEIVPFVARVKDTPGKKMQTSPPQRSLEWNEGRN